MCKNEDKDAAGPKTGGMVIYDPEMPLYGKRQVCIYLRELMDEAERESGDTDLPSPPVP